MQDADYEGSVEIIDKTKIKGWCFPTKSDKPAMLRVYVNDTLLRVVRADLARPDLEKKAGRPKCGFSMGLGADLIARLPPSCAVRVETSDGFRLPIASDAGSLSGDATDDGALLKERIEAGWIIDKWGSLKQPFSARPERKGAFLDAYVNLNKIITAELGLPLYLAYGALLGLEREGDFIGHDEDLDLAYNIPCETPAGAARHFYHVFSAFRDLGLQVKLQATGQFAVMFEGVTIDIFCSWTTRSGEFYLYFGAGGYIGTESLLLSNREMLGRPVIVPHMTPRVLELTYGPTWRIPDPAFQFSPDPNLARMMRQLEQSGKGLYTAAKVEGF